MKRHPSADFLCYSETSRDGSHGRILGTPLYASHSPTDWDEPIYLYFHFLYIGKKGIYR